MWVHRKLKVRFIKGGTQETRETNKKAKKLKN